MKWTKVKIGDFLTRIKEPVRIKSDGNYILVTIRMYHKGVGRRAEVKGASIKSPTLYSLRANQFILSGIDARNGAFGIVPAELDGAVVTNDFWTHNINYEVIDLNYFLWLTTTPQFYEACIKASEGTTNRKRLQADKFYKFELLLPSIHEQREMVSKISALNRQIEDLYQESCLQKTYLKKFRQSILHESVQGKLTRQALNSEPASKLLELIKAEKQQLTAHGQLKKEKQLPPITAEEIPFELPEGWLWCRLGEIINLVSGVTLGKSYKEELVTVPYLRVANVQRGFVDTNRVKELRVPKSEIDKYALKKDDLVMIEGGDWDKVGRCAIWDGRIDPCIHQNHIFRLRFYGNISSHWAELFLNSPAARQYFESCSKQTTNLASINKTQLSCTLFPLPPLSEQKKIVANAQQLLQTVSLLEEQIEESRTQAQHLLEGILKEAFQFSHAD